MSKTCNTWTIIFLLLLCGMFLPAVKGSLYAQQSPVIRIVPCNKKLPAHIIKTGDTIGLNYQSSGERTYRSVYYKHAVITQITPSAIRINALQASYLIYDSIRNLKIDSSVETRIPIHAELLTSGIQGIYVQGVRDGNEVLYGIASIAGTLGLISYFLAPPFAKTNSAGDLNAPVYYGMVGFGVVSMGLFVAVLPKMYFRGSLVYYSIKPACADKRKNYYATIEIL